MSKRKILAGTALWLSLGGSACGDGHEADPPPSAGGTETDKVSDATGASSTTGVRDPTTSGGESSTGDDSPPVSCPAVPIADEATQPVGPHTLVPEQLYVVYTELRQEDSSFVATSSIFVIRGPSTESGDEVWLFGTGYGDGAPLDDFPPPRPSQYPSRGAATDAADVHAVIRGCLGLEPERARLRLLTPHYHFDHMNADFGEALLAYGYPAEALDIYVHEQDYAATFCGEPCRGTPTGGGSIPPFSQQLQASAQTLGSTTDACGDVLGQIETAALGTWTIHADPGHTDGTISLQNPQLGVRLRGAALQASCIPPDPLIDIEPHDPVAAAWAEVGGTR